jgi:hypothetical protein
MEISRSPDTGLHQIITERDRQRATHSLENLADANRNMEVFIHAVWENNRKRRKIILAAGAVTALGLVGLGLALLKKSDPMH